MQPFFIGQATIVCGLFLLTLAAVQVTAEENSSPIVIAHRGASAYLPEHTLPAKALAYGMGADFLEQDVVLTADGHPIVVHDIHLERVTDVAERFPGRARADGRFYALDFTLKEIRLLRVRERTTADAKKRVYANRFPLGLSRFSLHTLSEEIEFIQGLNQATGKSVGIYTEIKEPRWHREQGCDISRVIVETLKRYGYIDKSSAAFVQCFDVAELRRVREELDCHLRLVQLLAQRDVEQDDDGDFVLSEGKIDLKTLGQYASGIGPDYQLLRHDGFGPKGRWSGLVDQAHAAGLVVHPYTLRADRLPLGVTDIQTLANLLVTDGKVDGFFTDHPDRVRVR
jgi:glycerophosphoryl diester phosphodiesterase